MTRSLLTTFILLLALSVGAQSPRYSFGGGASLVTLKGGDFFKFDWEKSYTFQLGHRLNDRWDVSLSYSSFTHLNDRTADSSGSVGSLTNYAPLEYQSIRVGLLVERKLKQDQGWWNVTTGFGAGALFWKGIDVTTNTRFVVEAADQGATDFSATELFLTGQAGLRIKPFTRVILSLDLRADYLTGAGRDFSDELSKSLDNLILSTGFRLSFALGSTPEPARWRTDSLWQAQPARPTKRTIARDGDGDGVNDDVDRCLATPSGAVVGPNGCALDSDNDGVPNGLDDCPGSHPDASGTVDLFGCPVDSDFDGVLDYLDACVNNPVGAIVDGNGCPIDSDADGVPDGLDDCLNTLTGLDVDKHGCVDLSGFAKPMVLNIDYPPGGFEIDPNNRERLKRLAATLNFVKILKLEIYGYTDNIGTSKANQQMSLKRARRVHDFLVANAVASERIRVEGKGETNFVASNQTAAGRAKNRRIVIIFYR